MSFLIGLLILVGVFIICIYLKTETVKKVNILMLSVVFLNFIPIPRDEHIFIPELAEYYEPQSIGLGWPIAFIKYYPNCRMDYQDISTNGQLREGYSINMEKSLENNPIRGKDYLFSDNNCPKGIRPAFDIILGLVINFVTAGALIFLIRKLIKS